MKEPIKVCAHCEYPLDSYDRCFCHEALIRLLRGDDFRPADSGTKGERDE